MTQVFRFEREARLQEILRAARMLGEHPEVLAVVLFGSLAGQGPRGAWPHPPRPRGGSLPFRTGGVWARFREANESFLGQGAKS